MQHEVTEVQDLLGQNGKIIEQGWARRPVWKYSRNAIRAPKLAIKEWDYYAIVSHEHDLYVTATFSDLGYAGLFALAFIDLKQKTATQVDAIKLLPLGKLGLRSDSNDHSISWMNERLRLAFSRQGQKRRILAASPQMKLPDGSSGLDIDVTLTQPESFESMNIATSWEQNRKAFYLNEKVNCMNAEGTIRVGNRTIQLQNGEAFGTLDWGRGRWTYKNRWYWSSLSTSIEGIPFGFNIGYGFSDRSVASENVLFYDSIVHKLDQVTFEIPQDDYMKPWKFTSSDGRFEMDFKPLVDRSSRMNLLLVKSVQHQVFGTFSGKAILDDGKVITLDEVYGFAEDVYNRY
ncbi:MAG: DUF2804 domain-containing protein [Sphaerochaetaceae bacterium]|jgi:hypothetical protein|nr:DUF2804 domain-containing protein [Sphaerochaetaceae bacterium]MDX9809073.1 DUF2804 domain-containing protein [Sphaerochaetaceae bacterium]